MYQNDDSRYTTALKYMTDIINSGKYDLVDNYAGIFRESGEWSTESIFEINYKDDQATRNYTDNVFVAGGTVLPTMMGPDGWVDGTDGHNNGWGTFRYVQKLIICTVMRILVVMVHVGMQQLPELIIPVIRIQAFS